MKAPAQRIGWRLPRHGLPCWIAFIPVAAMALVCFVEHGERKMIPQELLKDAFVSVGLALFAFLYWTRVGHWLKWAGLVFAVGGLVLLIDQMAYTYLGFTIVPQY
ncbi:MAG: hypothetical protein HC841_05485 [Verrucomicrobiae bacterium]|nr:hypothetical protein [Verrucomicrobiae bacterium]